MVRVTRIPAVDRILHSVVPGIPIDRSALDRLLAGRPAPDALLPLLADHDPQTVRAAVLYLGLYGSVRECPLLALCLQHADHAVVALAEHCLWAIWMRGGSAEGNARLADAIALARIGNHEGAIQLLSTLTVLEPAFSEAHFQLGLALAAIDRNDEAVRSFRQTMRLNPYHFAASAALGHAYVALGNLRGALHAYRQALKIHPHLEDVPRAVAELRTLVGQRRKGA
jgi:tetratricopeptide (TPR) repeat protein